MAKNKIKKFVSLLKDKKYLNTCLNTSSVFFFGDTPDIRGTPAKTLAIV